jgi:hypothetical protein
VEVPKSIVLSFAGIAENSVDRPIKSRGIVVDFFFLLKHLFPFSILTE